MGLVCVGDPAQLPAVARGGMFAHWCETLPAHHLEEVRRFTYAWEAETSLALRAGKPDTATAYAEAAAPLTPRRVINVEIQHRCNPTRSRPNVALANRTVAFVGDRIATRRTKAPPWTPASPSSNPPPPEPASRSP